MNENGIENIFPSNESNVFTFLTTVNIFSVLHIDVPGIWTESWFLILPLKIQVIHLYFLTINGYDFLFSSKRRILEPTSFHHFFYILLISSIALNVSYMVSFYIALESKK